MPCISDAIALWYMFIIKMFFSFNKKEKVYLDSPVKVALLIFYIHDSLGSELDILFAMIKLLPVNLIH